MMFTASPSTQQWHINNEYSAQISTIAVSYTHSLPMIYVIHKKSSKANKRGKKKNDLIISNKMTLVYRFLDIDNAMLASLQVIPMRGWRRLRLGTTIPVQWSRRTESWSIHDTLNKFIKKIYKKAVFGFRYRNEQFNYRLRTWSDQPLVDNVVFIYNQTLP